MIRIYNSVLRVTILLVFLLLAITPSRAADDTNGDTCWILEETDFTRIVDAPTKVTNADIVSNDNTLPTYCKVEGYVSPNVGFELRLPVNSWNGKFIMLGCGAYCGQLFVSSCDHSIQRGYACIVTDMGHKSTGMDAVWAYNNVQAEIDFAYRGTHVVTLAGKAITDHYYEKSPEQSYFMGCSTGGRQALVEAQRFPWDYDGIIAGAPVVSFTGSLTGMLWGIRSVIDSNNRAILGEDEVSLVHARAMAECDDNDGLKDGIIGNPLDCDFDPTELSCGKGQSESCLTPEQLSAVRKLYSGPSTTDGFEYFKGSTVPGSEMSWLKYFIGSNGGRSRYYDFVADHFRYSAFIPNPGPHWHLEDFDFDNDFKRLGMSESLSSGANPDLRKFKAAGGKLIAYMGWNDMMVANFVDYYQLTEKTMGGREALQDFFRAFLIPGMNHCSGGSGAYAVDYLSYLEAWVENGDTPDSVIGYHPKDGVRHPRYPIDPANIKFSRAHYPFPANARYRGAGDPDNASSFMPVDP